MMNKRESPHNNHRSVLYKSQFSKMGILEHTGKQETLSIHEDKETKQKRIIVHGYKIDRDVKFSS